MGLFVLWYFIKRRRTAGVHSLNTDEQETLDALLSATHEPPPRQNKNQ